jgi:LDH2 family malate/lactate/ureidoglycolate dehydrogenase
VDTFVEQIKASKLAPGSPGVFLPGEIEDGLQRERRERGIPLERRIVDELATLANDLNVSPPALRDA